ncbi:691_t:CDS:2 [Funneliformis geosporum]|uniref:691_t:CDS:1 n=1 Tax=Funneliformis geosporum TaxID=1117311 RepID=A0A9W4SQ79_9GLOM|nr:691_t:CDS:2 [Funneliformis geosporum]
MNTGGRAPSHRPITRSITRALRSSTINEQTVSESSSSRSLSNTQQITTVSRSRRGRRPKNTSVRIEPLEQTEQVIVLSEQPAEVEDLSAEALVISTEQPETEPETINETTGLEPVRSSVVEDNTPADQATDNEQRRNDRILQEIPGHRNQNLVVQIESNEVSVSNNKEAASKNKKRKNDIENNDAVVKKKKRIYKKPKPPKKPKEKRLSRFKTVCPKSIQQRICRAESERMYLISRSKINELHQEFVILGPTGNVYTIMISHMPNCTCPDFLKHKFCKHIIFVYLRVLRINRDSSHIYQNALLSEELRSIFANAAPDPTVLARYLVRKRYKEFISGDFSQKRRPIEGDCAICYEPLEEIDRNQIVWCQKSCGNNLHKECFGQWKKLKQREKAKVTCIYCRGDWMEDPTKMSISKDGYVNFGNF